ncbi:hypothetical protein F511_16330 [Dorcoceras hygrometricum]|uniref:Uncharacterized protein n=1 Tax=Dorcoceras hygrometricum TaxID=472368 RepID=A0A2Z7BXK6_9LAMI|nr:hypothetical protein F511_16330 [Dorcoceras hygrometricum]
MAAINGGVKINWIKLLFNIFKDIVTPGSKQAKGYAIQICLMLKNVPHLALGDSKEFPASKILTAKTVHRYIAVVDKSEVEDVSRVKKTPVKKAVSRKRPAAVDKPVVKKKRTCVGKVSAVTTSPALEAVPIQTVSPISTMPPSAPKRKIQKRKRRLALGSDDETVEEPTAVAVVAIENPVPAYADVVDEGISTTDDVDNIIEQVIAETTQLETEEEVTDVSISDVGDQEQPRVEEMEHWFNLSYEEFVASNANRRVETAIDTDGEPETVVFETVVQEQTVQTVAAETESRTDVSATYVVTEPKDGTDDESLSLEETLLKISEDSFLPSAVGEITKIQFSKGISIKGVNEGDWYKASLPKIPANSKGKSPLTIVDTESYVRKLHGLQWDGESCSVFFEGETRDCGAVIARSNTNFRSPCWIRTMIMVDGSWVIEPCADYWKILPRPVVCTKILPQISYVDTLPPISEFFKVMQKRWADICTEAAQFFVSGKLLPGGSLNFCRTIVVVEPVSIFGSQRPTVTPWCWFQICTASVRYSLFSGLSTVDIRNFVSTLALDRSVLRDVQLVTRSVSVAPSAQISIASVVNQVVQIATSSVFEDQNAQMVLNQRPHSRTTSDESSMHFDDDEMATAPISLPAIPTDLQASFAQLRASIEQLQFEQLRRKYDTEKLKDILLMHIRDLEKQVNARFDEHDRAYRALLTNILKDMHDHKTALSLDIVRSHQKLSTQVAAAALDNVDVQKEVKDQRAMITDLDGQVATVRSELWTSVRKPKRIIYTSPPNLASSLITLIEVVMPKRGKVAVAADLNRLLTIKLDLVEAAPVEKVVTAVAEDLRVVVVANKEEALVVDQVIDNVAVAVDLVLVK